MLNTKKQQTRSQTSANLKQEETRADCEKPQVQIFGSVHKVLFQDSDSGYAVFLVITDTGTVTVTGTVPALVCGQDVRIEGSWITHPRYGRQLESSKCYSTVPSSKNGLIAYLGSGFIKGIGPIVAERIVQQLGINILEIIDTQPQQLLQVPGIGEKRLAEICASWQEHKTLAHVLMFLQEKGLSAAYAARLTKQYRERTIAVLEQNPYQLIDDVWGIGFTTADIIAQKIGISRTAPLRISAAVKATLTSASNQGNLYVPETAVIEQVSSLLQFSEDERSLIPDGIQSLIQQNFLVRVSHLETQLIGLMKGYLTEQHVATYIKALQAAPRTLPCSEEELSSRLHALCEQHRIKLTEEQHHAIIGSFSHGVSIITGGPGTGKTTLVRALIALMDQLSISYKLAAPTGRAAKRLSESTGRTASTIHRLLELNHEQRTEQEGPTAPTPIKARYLILDESSMIDIFLAHTILSALQQGSQLILIGDIDQLPPVGPGNFLKDCIASDTIHTTRLTHIFRQAHNSLITMNAHRIRNGDQLMLPGNGRASDFGVIHETDPQRCLDHLKTCIDQVLPARGFTTNDLMVLAPMNRGVAGTHNLNAVLQAHLNPHTTASFTKNGTTFRVGDRVMQIRNNYDKLVFNGDIGTVTAIDSEAHECQVQYDSRVIMYHFEEAEELALAYAITIHKSQGSEFPVVILPLFMQHFMMLKRTLLYTAITRARKLCIIIGERKAIAIAIRQESHTVRTTLLETFLRNQ